MFSPNCRDGPGWVLQSLCPRAQTHPRTCRRSCAHCENAWSPGNVAHSGSYAYCASCRLASYPPLGQSRHVTLGQFSAANMAFSNSLWRNIEPNLLCSVMIFFRKERSASDLTMQQLSGFALDDSFGSLQHLAELQERLYFETLVARQNDNSDS